ncbi:MAG: choice-of-anchor tandem repeat GloVer-containing protein [Terriglobales bacterium]
MDSENKNIARGKSFDVSHFSWKTTSAALALVCVLLLVVRIAHAQSETVLYSFLGAPDGANPIAGVILDAKGNLYGTTDNGGTSGLGTVFKLAPDGDETVLYSFAGHAEGANPYAGLVRGKKGYLYGATLYTGDNETYGTLFKVSPKGVHTVLYAFTGGADGADPYGENLILDKAGNLYGTGYSGGTFEEGVVFEFSASGTESVLYSFTGGTDGARPYAGVVEDKLGNFYGTTLQGGAFGLGTVYKVTPSGTETVLHSFAGGSDGATPYGGVILDSKGNLYGTTAGGGSSSAGIVFKLSPSGTETLLHTFAGGADGANPTVALVRDKAGNLYGTTSGGGSSNDGTVFEFSPSGTHTILYTFTGGADGAEPGSDLILDKQGNLYGTTIGGGTLGLGVVYKVTP